MATVLGPEQQGDKLEKAVCREERQPRTTNVLHTGPYLLGVTGYSDEDTAAGPGRVPKHCFRENSDPRNLCFPANADLGLNRPPGLHHNCIPGSVSHQSSHQSTTYRFKKSLPRR